jgi:protein-S-isoprenylcysteine O-methyltransferase Ste14
MSIRWPSLGLLAVTAFSVVVFFGLATLGWGSVSGLVEETARASGLLVIAFAAIASLFSGIHLGGCARPDAHGRWRLVPLVVISVALAWLPAYSDSRNLATIDGDATRYLGLALLVIGGVMRVAPMFILGDRFTWPLATQRGHEMLTTGFYRFIRHPSYSGALIGGVGWVLLFRSGVGLVLIAMLFPFFLPLIDAEEALLRLEFGESYVAYQSRTWKLLPFLY